MGWSWLVSGVDGPRLRRFSAPASLLSLGLRVPSPSPPTRPEASWCAVFGCTTEANGMRNNGQPSIYSEQVYKNLGSWIICSREIWIMLYAKVDPILYSKPNTLRLYLECNQCSGINAAFLKRRQYFLMNMPMSRKGSRRVEVCPPSIEPHSLALASVCLFLHRSERKIYLLCQTTSFICSFERPIHSSYAEPLESSSHS